MMLAVALLAGCSRTITPAEQGAEVAADPKFSKSIYNAFACTTCHAARAGEGERRLAGAPLAGATARPSFWGGAVLDLFEAVSACYRQFMQGGRLDRESEEARALYAYLVSLETDPAASLQAVPFTLVRTTAPPAPGDAGRGRETYARACAFCHGEPRKPRDQLGESAILPDDTERTHPRAAGFTEETIRQVIVQKVRNGGYLGFTGFMPPFSREALADEEIADIITYLGPKLE
jgi:thiosulfate dehydrogenase